LTIRKDRRTAGALAALALGLAGGWAALYFLDPETPALSCLFHSLTGYYCPGCGLTRAGRLAAHGHLWAAFRMNPLAFALGAPLLVWTGIWGYCRLKGRPVPQFPAWAAWAALAAILGFWVLRNLPFPPFCWLAPTPLT
jgi:hypothetical protein